MRCPDGYVAERGECRRADGPGAESTRVDARPTDGRFALMLLRRVGLLIAGDVERHLPDLRSGHRCPHCGERVLPPPR